MDPGHAPDSPQAAFVNFIEEVCELKVVFNGCMCVDACSRTMFRGTVGRCCTARNDQCNTGFRFGLDRARGQPRVNVILYV